MTDSISFGKGKNAGKVDLTKVKDGLTKQQIAGNNKKLQSIFDKVDSNHNEVLEQDELMEFQKQLGELAGEDNQLTDKEAKGFKDAGGHKMGRRHRKAFYEFLNKLAANEQEPKIDQQAAPELQAPPTDAANLTEMPETIQTIVSEQKADEIVQESETKEEDDAPETISEETVAEPEAETEPEVTTGIIVQNGESPAAIAKKFGVPLQELLDANQGQLKGKGKNKYFVVGAEIVIPKKYSDEELTALTAGRKSAAEANADYAQQMAIREQRRAQQKAQMEALGIVNRKGAGTVVSTKTKATEDGKFANFSKNDAEYQKMTYTVVGETGNRGRMIVKASNGKYYTMARDGIILKETYAKATKAYDAGKAQARNDGRGRQVVNVDGQEYVFSQDGKLLKSSHVQATDTRDAGKASKTVSGNQTSFVKDKDGKVHYFDKNGQLITGDQRKQLIRAEAEKAADTIYKAAAGMGTDEDQLSQGVNMIYSPEIMAEVNAILKTKHIDYAGTTQTTPLEALLLDELSRSEVRGHIQTLAKNGAYGTGEAKDAALGRNAAREIQYEVHGGVFGYTGTKDLNEAMNVASTRGARLATEDIMKDKVKGGANDGSYVRQYIKEDDLGIDWSAQEIDQFDANWVKNGAYDHEHDQDHRNAVTGRLIFEYGNKESLHKGLEAIDPESVDYQYVSTRAAEANKTNNYQAHFKNQDALQTYIAGRATDNNEVETPEVSACNTLLYKGEKPVRIQAEEALYDAKSGDFSTMFNSMDPKVYTEMATMLADGEVSGCKNMQEAYEKALNSATTLNDKATIKANAILSGQIEFSDAEITDFCVELMHKIDANKGDGASSGVSAEYTNIADYMTIQLKAILQANPQVIAAVKEQVENGTFTSTSTKTTGGGSYSSGAISSTTTTNNKNLYLAIIKDSKYVADDIILLDKDGNKITNSEEIAAITNANMEALQGMRDYVAQLERDFKKGVDAEGGLSDMANGVMTIYGIGTDRDDVATQYRNAKIMLAQLEAAAQGKLRDSEGNVISAQDLAQKFIETQDKLAQTNSDYQSSIQMTKMGIILAPVIAVTTVVSGGTAALGWGTVASATTVGIAAGATTYGLNAYEYNTSLTGNTAEAREQNAIDSAIAGVSTGIGFGQMKPIMGMGNNLNTIARTTTRLATTITSDVTVGAAGEYVATGNVSAQGTLMNMAFSAVPNVLGARQFSHKTNIHPTPAPQANADPQPVHVSKGVKGDVNNYRDAIADGVVARNADQKHLNANQRRMLEDGLADIPTPEELAAYQKEIAYQPVPEADRPAFETHQKQVAKDYAEAHELGNMVDAQSAEALQRAKANMEADAPAAAAEPPATPAPKTANEEAIEKLTQSISDINKQIARLENNMKSAARRGKQVTPQQKQQLERMQANKAAKQAELDALQRPTAEPEVVVRAEESVEAEGVVVSGDEEIRLRPNADPAPKAQNKYSTDTKGFITPENYSKMTPDELVAEYRRLSEYEADGVLGWSEPSPSGKIFRTNTHDMRGNKYAIREALEKQGLELTRDHSKGGEIPEYGYKKAETPPEPKLTPEQEQRVREDFNDPATLSDEDLLNGINRLRNRRRYFDKNGVERETNHTQRLRELEAELNKRGLEVQDGKLVTTESIARDAQAIPDSAIPTEHRSLWKSCQERIGKIFSGAGKLAMGEVKTVLKDIKTVYNTVKNVKVKEQISKLYKRIQAYAKSKAQTPEAQADAPAPAASVKSPEERVIANQIIGDIQNAKTERAIDAIQAKIDRLPESSPYKTELQRQLNEKYREINNKGMVLGGAADPANNNPAPIRTSEPAKPANSTNSAANANWQMSADNRSHGFQRNMHAETNITALTPDEVSVSGNSTGYGHFVGPTAKNWGVNPDFRSGIPSTIQKGQAYSVYNAEANVTAIGVLNDDSFHRSGLFQILVKGQVSEADATALIQTLKDKNLIPNMKDGPTPEVRAKAKQVQEVTAQYFNKRNT